MENFKHEQRSDSARKSRLARATAWALIILTVSCFAFIFAACGKKDGSSETPPAETPPEETAAKLIFSDEFDGAELNGDKWFVHGAEHEQDAPGELRRGGWWTGDSVSVNDGNLVITTTYDVNKNTFYTGSVDSKKLMTYGYYEARCKAPEANGMWSAFWLMCNEMGLEEPDARIGGAEIDIYESPYYGFNNGMIQHAVHTAGYGSKKSDYSSMQSLTRSDGVANGYQEWHTYALDWQPDSYTFYVDGKLTWTTKAPYGRQGSAIYYPTNVSAVPSYIILSVEVAGTGGVPGMSPFFLNRTHPVTDNNSEYDMSQFSVDFLIDYVRVWDKNPY